MDINVIIISVILVSGILGCLYFIHLGWKSYGAFYLISAISANLLCYIFTFLGLYSFPDNALHREFIMPAGVTSTVFPLMAMIGIRYSPEKWIWKIPFYWGIVHLGVLGEVILKATAIFKFEPEWDLWDSYTLWWLYFLLFELLGSKMVPNYLRKPIDSGSFRYGRWGWIVFHVIVITTIFLAGVYVGVTLIE